MKRNDIAIAVCTPLSGRAAALGEEMTQAIRIAVDDKGYIGPHRLILKIYDDESRTEKAAENARNILNDESIYGVIGNYGSDTTLAAARLFDIADVPIVIPVASNPMLTDAGLSNVFRYTNSDDSTGRAIAGYLYSILTRRSALVVKTETAYGRSMSGQFISAFTAAGGVITGTFSVEEGTKDLSSLVAKLRSGFDMIFYGGTYEGAPLLRALREAGYMQLMATGDGCWDAFNFLLPADGYLESGEGVLVLSASSAVGTVPGSLAFADKYVAATGKDIGNYALNCYDTACLLIRAMDRALADQAGDLSRRKVRDALRAVSFNGVANPSSVQFDEKGDNMNAITVLNVVSDGQFKEISTVRS